MESKPPVPPQPTGQWTLMGPVTAPAQCPVLVTLTEQQPAEGLYYFEVPDGTYRLSGFADCNENGVEDSGDLRYYDDTDGKPYRSYTLEGRGTVSLPLVIDRPVP